MLMPVNNSSGSSVLDVTLGVVVGGLMFWLLAAVYQTPFSSDEWGDQIVKLGFMALWLFLMIILLIFTAKRRAGFAISFGGVLFLAFLVWAIQTSHTSEGLRYAFEIIADWFR